MKINSISFLKPITTQKYERTNPVKSNTPQAFTGVFDVFKKQNQEPSIEEEKTNRKVVEIVESAKRGDRALQKCGKTFLKELNHLLKIGSKADYKGNFQYFSSDDKQSNITFSDVNNLTGVPDFVNVWLDGKPKSVYEIYLREPQSLFHVISYGENSVTEFNFAGKSLLEYLYKNDQGDVIQVYPAEDGFIQQYGKRVNEDESFLMSKLYYDKKHPEKSYYIENGETELTEYRFNKESKLWVKARTISQDEFDIEED